MKAWLSLIIGLSFISSFAQSNQRGHTYFHVGLDLQTKYVWRGMEMMTEESTPVFFPSLYYENNGWYAYVMGGTSLNGKYSELDLGLSYTYKWVTFAVNDYFYPTIDNIKDQYFNFSSHSTGHWLEGAITLAPDNVPLYLTVSNFFAGADKNLEGNQAYSTYMELGYHYDFLEDNSLALTAGAALNKSCYNGYEHDFSVCNVELKYTYTLTLFEKWSLPVSAAYIINPVNEKAFVNLSTHISF